MSMHFLYPDISKFFTRLRTVHLYLLGHWQRRWITNMATQIIKRRSVAGDHDGLSLRESCLPNQVHSKGLVGMRPCCSPSPDLNYQGRNWAIHRDIHALTVAEWRDELSSSGRRRQMDGNMKTAGKYLWLMSHQKRKGWENMKKKPCVWLHGICRHISN